MERPHHGRLGSPGPPPACGERTDVLVHWPGGTRIEEISSGSVPVPVEYLQAHDEWVLVLQGGAVLSVGDRRFGLGAGDWLLLPGAIPHRLEHVEPGTRWLAVHGPPARASDP